MVKSINLKGKEYVEVNERLKIFRGSPIYKGYSMETTILDIAAMAQGVVTMQAVIRNPEGVIVATGYAQEKENASMVNKTSFIENCETSAWGRALANLGIGIDTAVASYEEVANAIAQQQAVQEEAGDDECSVIRAEAGKLATVDAINEYYRANKNRFKQENLIAVLKVLKENLNA